MKIYFNRIIRRSPWGGGAHYVSAMADHLIAKGHDVVNSLGDNPDVIFMIDPRWEDGGSDFVSIKDHKLKNPNVKIIHRINECDQRKGTKNIDQMLMLANSIADKTVFISSWLQDYFAQKGLNPNNSSVIVNGCNQHFYYKEVKKISEPIKVVTHHWSDNFMKGFDVYEFLDRYCVNNSLKFTYIGRWNKSVQTTNTNLVDPLYGKELGDELRKHHIYITASRWEPCGMHHIEGASCGLPVLYHAEGGGINEICKNHGLEFNSPETLVAGLMNIINNYDKYVSMIDNKALSMDRCCEQYEELL